MKLFCIICSVQLCYSWCICIILNKDMILTDDQNKRHVSFMFFCSVTTLITRQMSVVFFFLYNFAYIVTRFILNRKLTTFASEIKCHMSISCNTFLFNRWNSLTLYIMYILAKKCADGRILSYLASLNCVLLMNIRYSGQANDMHV